MASCLLLGCLYAAPAAAQALLMKEPGKAAPALAFIDESGQTHSLTAGKGKLTAVHFWASWCTPCIAELPQVDAAAQAYGAKGFTVIAISLDDRMDKVTGFLSAHHIAHLAPYLDKDAASFQSVRAAGLPATLFIDAAGREIARAEGPLDWNSPAVKSFIEAHLK